MDQKNDAVNLYGENNSVWLAATRLIPPTLPENIITRTKLIHELKSAVYSTVVTLISAPAGYGKTTLAAEFCQSLEPQSFAWLSLTKNDNDPIRLIVGMMSALERTVPGCCKTTSGVLSSLTSPGVEAQRLIGVLINDLLEIAVRPFVLVLDDLHVVQAEESLQLLEALIEHLPGHFRLVLASRTDPVMSLPLLRSRGRLAEFRLDQLRFSSLEISKFLQPYIDSKLSSEDVQRIKDRTEGWAALLRLLTIKSSLISGSQVSDVFSGESQQSDLHIFDFLAEEVLGQLPQHEREFLVKTSILPNLNEDLCKAVTNQPASAEILEALHRRNLVYFLGSVPSKSGQFQINQYRYHDLFAEFLVSRLGRSSSESEIQDLHIRAAQSQPDTEQALQHMLWAEQWDDAAMLISHLGNQMVFMGFLDTLNDWIAQIPAVTRQTIPELAYFSGVIAFQRGRFDHAQQQLELALAGFEDAGNDQKKGETILVLGAIASGFHDVVRGAELLEEALTYPLALPLRIMAHINRAWVGVYSNNWSLVEKDVTTAIRLVITSEEPGAFNVLAPHLTAVLLYMPKGVQRLKSYSAQVLASSEEEFVLSKVGANALMGVIYLMEGKIEDAYQSLLQARRGSDIMGGFVWLDIGIDFAILNHALINADYAGFSTYWQSRLRHFEQNAGAREYLTGFLYIKGRALAYQGRLAEASELYGQMMENENADDIPENQLVRGLMGALLMIFEGKFQQAEEILRQVSGMQLQAPHSVLFGDARVFLTFLYFKWGRTEDALAEFQVVVKDYERRSMLGLLLDEGALLQPLFKLAVDKDVCAVQARWLIETLDGARQVQPIFIHSTGETLTLREVDVFALIAQGLTNRQIANKLFIGETTVKSHTTSILRKLGVQTRTQAAARARDLNLF